MSAGFFYNKKERNVHVVHKTYQECDASICEVESAIKRAFISVHPVWSHANTAVIGSVGIYNILNVY